MTVTYDEEFRATYTDTVRCRYNVHNFLENPHNWYVIARPLVRGMGFLLWVQTQIYETLNHCIAVGNTVLYWTAL